ncbi:MAG: thioredoxin family protein [Deltaproteobacteria bacterium]|nr:thioredoxin family protein [Deltaproteobacteria bacterium]
MSENKFQTVKTAEELQNLIDNEDGILIYFSHEKCNVCKVLKPKIADRCKIQFPKIKLLYADTELTPEISGQYSVFTVPSVIVFLGGKEFLRESRNISIETFTQKLERPYKMLFS